MRYDVDVGIYEGPLSLLVELAKLNLLDLFVVKLRGLTEQYLALVKAGGPTLNDLAEPLPLLGQLLAMKSRLLLPQPPLVSDEEDAAISMEELQRRLAEYEQFKSVSQVLAQLHELQHEYLARLHASEELAEVAPGSRIPLEESGPLASRRLEGGREVGLLDLMSAFARVLDRAQTPVYEVVGDAWTVEMKVGELRLRLALSRQLSFGELFPPDKSKLELVVIFLALLELVRQRLCSAVQERPFGEIVIVRREA
ncbi:MAG: segregation/condensation protein A [Candidatus Omnitrophica bacterium]|nr:segregation/condensation protein A [Candidatus Omnitrophota bacterium]